jgi:hypothetical protein
LEEILVRKKQGDFEVNNFDDKSMFKLHSEYAPTGDQPQAIGELVEGFREGNQFETLVGGNGFGKDVYYGECHTGCEQTDFGNFAQ